MRTYAIFIQATNGQAIRSGKVAARNRWDALHKMLADWREHDRRDIAKIEIAADSAPYRADREHALEYQEKILGTRRDVVEAQSGS